MDCKHYAILKLLCGQLWSFRKNNFLCDTTIVANDRDLPAHSVVLAAGSSSFRAAFEGSSGDETRYRIKIPHMSGDMIEDVLFLIYNGCFSNPDQKLDGDFLHACEQLGVCWIKDQTTASEAPRDLEWIVSMDACAENALSMLTNDENAIVHVRVFENDQQQETLQEAPESSPLKHEEPVTPDDHGSDDRKPLVCDMCSKSFDNEIHLEAHLKSHVAPDPLNPYACDLCPLIFSTTCQLKQHCVGHKGRMPTTYQRKSLTKHFRQHRKNANNRLICDVCGMTFTILSDLRKHQKLHEKKTEDQKPPKCDRCQQFFVASKNSHGVVLPKTVLLCGNCKSLGNNSQRQNHTNDSNNIQNCALKCSHCVKWFANETELNMHAATHDERVEEKPHGCEKCGHAFKCIKTLEKHRMLHNKEDCYVCYVCHQGFRQSYYLQKHLRRHDGNNSHECSMCAKTFRESYLLRKHMLTHDVTEARFQCNLCGRAFRQEYYLKKHYKRHTGELNYACEYCGKRFKENYQLLKHVRIHSMLPRHPCGTCNRMFRDEQLLRKHRSVHEVGNAHPCEVCGKTFKVRTSLNTHRKLHIAEKQTCAVCGLTLGSLRELRRHEMAAHARVTPATHQCCECGKLFMNATHLRSHARTHSSERPHACPICQRSFRRHADMRSHVLTHTGQKSNLCSVCGKGFLKKSDLKRHYQGHKDERPYVCDTCGKGFKLLNYLKEHLHTHATKKEFVCSDCKKAFNSIGNLKNHLKIHSGLKPHKCPVCSKEFLRPANLRSHLKVHVKNSEPILETCSPLEKLEDVEKYALSDASQISE